MSVWITRSAPDNLRTARGLRALGQRSLMVPVITTAAIYQPLAVGGCDAAIFTSVHAVRHFARHRRLAGVPIFAPSGAVAEAAVAMGHCTVTHIGGDEAALAELIGHVLPRGARILLICGKRHSAWLAERLTQRGYEVERQAVYKPVPTPDHQLAHVVGALDRIGAIVLHSRSGAERIAPILRNAGWRGALWCISQKTVECCDRLPGVDVLACEQPSEASLLDMIQRLSPAGSQMAGHHRRNADPLAITLQRERGHRAQNDNAAPWPPTDEDPYRPAS